MRRIKLLAAMCAAALAFTACETPPVWNWPDFPEERFKAYLPYEEVEEVRFVSERGDSVTWSITEVEYYYEEPCADRRTDCYGNENVFLCVKMTTEDELMVCSLNSTYRRDLSYGVGIGYGPSEYGETLLCGGAGAVDKIRNFDRLLTDTLKCDEVGDCVIVNGEGLVEYTLDGVKWRTAE